MIKTRLDVAIVQRGLLETRSQAESYIKLGSVRVNSAPVNKPGFLVSEKDTLDLLAEDRYVSRAGLKLASVAKMLKLNFMDTIVLDVGSSTGGFTDFALRNGAQKVIAVDVGTDQMHPLLRQDERIELHEKTDIRNFALGRTSHIDMVVIDVSFISLRQILPTISQLLTHNSRLTTHDCLIVAMVKPQFEAGPELKHKGVIKNDKMRRDLLKDFELWAQGLFVVIAKADSEVAGAKGNRERFYLLKPLP